MSTAVPAAARTESIAAPFAALVAGAVAMGVSPVLVRLAEIGPFASAFWRVVLALPALWLWMRLAERDRPTPEAARFARPTVYAGLLFGADLLLWHSSIRHTTVANATFFATCAPLWVVLFGWLLFRQGVSRPVLAGLGLCVLGGAAIVAQSMGIDRARLPGDLSAIVTGVVFGLFFLALGAARRGVGAARVTFEMSVISAGVLGVAALLREGDILPPDARCWAVLLALALVSHVAGQGLLSVALGRLPAVFSSLVVFLEAIVAALVAWAVLGEAVTAVQALGGALILLGIWLARPREAAGA